MAEAGVPGPDVPDRRARSRRPRAREVEGARLAELDRALHAPAGGGGPQAVRRRVADSLATGGADVAWLVLATLLARLPEEHEVAALLRRVRLDGAGTALDAVLRSARRSAVLRGAVQPVRVTSEVLVDVGHTLSSGRATGVQRVTRELARRWAERDGVVLVTWSADLTSLRGLTGTERALLAGTGAGAGAAAAAAAAAAAQPPSVAEVVVPWGGTYVLAEVALERPRTARVRALARRSRSRTAAVGFDCIPVTSAETTDAGVSEHFAHYLAALRDMTLVVAISEAAAGEFRGWTRMLPSVGRTGPTVVAVPLADEVGEVTADARTRARRLLCAPGLPLVLCVGSHEPRKNHLGVLHAAELAWRAGRRFSLAFVGSQSWGSAGFDAELARLRAAGRPVATHRGIDDATLWAAYAEARFLAFPSLHEGYGLPAAECLTVGTPVLTSGQGSLAEVAAGGGALTVDPRDDDALVAAFDRLLVDDTLRTALRSQAAARTVRTWDRYARDTWDVLREVE